MSVRHSPNKAGTSAPQGGSLTDLTKITLDSLDAQITQRKRKQPERDCNCYSEFQEFRQEFGQMRELLEKIIYNQEQSMKNIHENLADIKTQISEVKSSTSILSNEQSNMKLELHTCKNQISSGENKIQNLEQNINGISTKIEATETKLQTIQSYLSSLNPEKAEPVIQNECLILEIQDRKDRLKNIIISGIPELCDTNLVNRRSHDEREVIKILNNLSTCHTKPVKIFRVGKPNPEKIRHIKVCFNNEETPKELLINRSKIDKPIKIFSDQTPMQQKYYKKINDELKRRQSAGEVDITIKYIRGLPTIITTSKN